MSSKDPASARFALELQSPSPTLHRLGPRPLHLGRARTNDLVLLDDTVSSRHAILWVADGTPRVEDVHSRNGTFVNDERVTGTRELAVGDQLRLGETTVFRVLEVGQAPTAALIPLLEDVDAGIRYPLHTDRFRIGPMATSELVVPDASEAVVVVVHGPTDLQLGRGDDMVDLEPDEVFDVGTRRFCLRLAADQTLATREMHHVSYPYLLEATLDGPTGPEAIVRHTAEGSGHVVSAENRAVLLYLLGRQFTADRTAGAPRRARGWVSDNDLATGVWGRAGNPGSNLRVLVCRLRSELRDAGFDPWFIEKRRGYLRARVADALVR